MKTQIRKYTITAGILLCLFFAAAFFAGMRVGGGWIGYAVMALAGAVFFLFTLRFLQKTEQNISGSLTYMERRFEKYANGDFSEETEETANLTEDFSKLAEYAEIMRQNTDSQKKESEQKTAELLESIERLKGQTDELRQRIAESAGPTEEIIASLERITAVSDQIHPFSKEVEDGIEHTSSQVKRSEEDVHAVSMRADGIKKEALKRRQRLRHNQMEMKDSFLRSLKALQAVEEISNLAEAVMEITEKTNLLSLNASIEAAKAGQAGNGFSVVADEIRKLANQSKKKIEKIQWISGEANFAVDSLKEDSGTLLQFVDSKVLSDFDFFMDMAEIYDSDAENMENAVAKLEKICEGLFSSIQSILKAAREIDDAAKNSFSNVQKLKNL